MSDLVQLLRRMSEMNGADTSTCRHAANRIEADEVLMRQALEFFERMDNSGLPMRSHERTTIAALRKRLGDTNGQ